MTEPSEAGPGGSAALVFVHLPKTAGTTLGRVLARQFPARERFAMGGAFWPGEEAYRRLRERRTPAHRLFFGHMAYGLHRELGRPAVYATMLREPRARLTSAYRFAAATPAHPFHEAIARRGLSLQGFLEAGLMPEMDNAQVRFLGEDPHLPFGEAADATLERALANLETVPIIGITERFDESLLLMARRLGWTRPPWYVRRNVGAPRPAAEAERDPPSPELEGLIGLCTRLDEVLYRAALVRFAALRIEAGLTEADVARFRRHNATWGRALLSARGVWVRVAGSR